MADLKNYYNISLFGEDASVAEFQKKYSVKLENGYDSYVYLRANDALEYVVRLGRKDKKIIPTLDKILWNLTECATMQEKIPLLKNKPKEQILIDITEGQKNHFNYTLQEDLIYYILIGDFNSAFKTALLMRQIIAKRT